MTYHITFQKNFGRTYELDQGEFEWLLYSTPDLAWCLDKARKYNSNPLINIQVEVFRVWSSEKGKYNRKTAKLIYPTDKEPLFN